MAYNYIHVASSVSSMIKKQPKKIEGSCQAPGAVLLNACMDCMFWYQCRRGSIDCHVKTRQTSTSIVRA